ncbi:MAG: glycosyltransferase, partial [Acidobacteriaceae bacterium]|nr:glycosyltransferase [Acidobacteriaceae bacterium]
MRADAVARALARRDEVHLAVPRPDGAEHPGAREGLTLYGPEQSFRDSVRNWMGVHLPAVYRRLRAEPRDWMAPDSRTVVQFVERAKAIQPDRAHVFRAYMIPFCEALLEIIPCQLDLDECESRTRHRIADLARQNGHAQIAESLAQEAQFYEKVEQQWLPRFERVFVASEGEREYLLERDTRLKIDVLPNTMGLPCEALQQRRILRQDNSPFTLLFVGDLSYYPNVDGISYFVREVLPILRERSRDVRLEVVGGGASRLLRNYLSEQRGVEFSGYVRDLGSVYARADAVVVPLR